MNTFGREILGRTPSVPAWQAQVVGDYTQLAQHGIDFIQLDGFPKATPACFNPAHGHPLGGGGNWQYQAWRKLVSDVRSSIRAANQDAGLSSEGGNELYLPWIDLYFSRDNIFESFLSDDSQAGWEVIPLFEYLYHP